MKSWRDRRILGLAALSGLSLLTFTIVYAIRPSDAVSRADDVPEPPGPDALPSPDTNLETPFAGGQYFNEENQKGPFTGELNGLRILPFGDPNKRTVLELCPPSGWTQLANGPALNFARDDAELRIPILALPKGVVPVDVPIVFACGDEGKSIRWHFQLEAGMADVGATGGTLQVARTRGQDYVTFSASEERWSTTTIAGLPGVVAEPVRVEGQKVLGQCLAAVRNPSTNILTLVTASAATLDFCKSILETVVSE